MGRFGGFGGYPFAVKIAAGKINAVSGEDWSEGLNRDPQDYVVLPRQPWLDGFCVEKGKIRQFVAAPLGKGITAEEQFTGAAEHGGIQIVVHPMKEGLATSGSSHPGSWSPLQWISPVSMTGTYRIRRANGIGRRRPDPAGDLQRTPTISTCGTPRSRRDASSPFSMPRAGRPRPANRRLRGRSPPSLLRLASFTICRREQCAARLDRALQPEEHQGFHRFWLARENLEAGARCADAADRPGPACAPSRQRSTGPRGRVLTRRRPGRVDRVRPTADRQARRGDAEPRDTDER